MAKWSMFSFRLMATSYYATPHLLIALMPAPWLIAGWLERFQLRATLIIFAAADDAAFAYLLQRARYSMALPLSPPRHAADD